MRALFTALAIAALPTAAMAQTPPPAEIPALHDIAVAPSPERIEADIATLVGFGTRLGNGCTSGHGVCGIARLSPRSLAATGVFMASAALTVFIIRHALGG